MNENVNETKNFHNIISIIKVYYLNIKQMNYITIFNIIKCCECFQKIVRYYIIDI